MKKEKTTIKIGGMTCVNCSNSIEKVVKRLDGVDEVSVNFSSGNGVFTYDKDKVSIEKIEEKIKKLGFSVLKENDQLNDENRSLLIAFIIALIGTIFLHFYDHFFHNLSHNSNLYISFIVASIVQFGPGFRFYEHSYKALSNKTFDMNVLVALGTSVAYFYSVFVTFIPNIFPENLQFTYFDGASMIITFILLGRYLEARARKKATSYMQTLLDLIPKDIEVVNQDGSTTKKKLSLLNINDIFIVKSGQNIALDGIVVSGNGEVDTSLMSGESMLLHAKENTDVLAGYSLRAGFLHVKVKKEYKDTKLAKVIELLNNAGNQKMPIARLADKISSIFVPLVILIAIVTFIVWFFLGDTKMAILASSCVLIISCPCALGLATPIAIVSGVSRGAKEGIFIKNPEVLEIVSKIKYAVFDKTGTLTKGKIRVSYCDIDDLRTLSKIASIETKSEHPLSFAICNFAKDKNANPLLNITNFEVVAGFGVKGFYENEKIAIGNEEFLKNEKVHIKKETLEKYYKNIENGISTIIASINNESVGIFCFEDEIKDNAKNVVNFLKSQNIITVMLTGDKELPAKNIAQKIGIELVISEVLPDEKYNQIIKLQESGKVMFVGDGINDSPSLKIADIGVAMNSGADVAKEAGDIILIKNDLLGVKKSINLSKNTLKIIHQNLFWAFIYNVIGIPLAAGVFYPFTLTPVYASVAMSISSVTVVLNSLRLKLKSIS